jgi:hypothetical protein
LTRLAGSVSWAVAVNAKPLIKIMAANMTLASRDVFVS